MKKKSPAIVCMLWDRHINVLLELTKVWPHTIIFQPRFPFSLTLKKFLERHGSKIVMLDTMLGDEEKRAINLCVSNEILKWEKIVASKSFIEASALTGCDRDIFRTAIARGAAKYLPYAVPLIECLDIATRRYDVKLLVLSEDLTANGMCQ